MKMCLKLIFLSIIIETFVVIVEAQINLATQGVAIQSSNYPNYPAILAIEGPANNKWNAGCSVTADSKKYSWWALNLPAVAHMTNILIYYREDFAHRMDQFRLYLENGTADQISASGLCYSDIEIAGPPALTQNITCNMLAKNMYFVNSRTSADCYVELCYVAIYGCWKGFWGQNCTVPCPPTCIGKHCYPANGSCVWGCDNTNCMNKNCYKATGVCLGGCVFGQAGQYCNKHNVAYNQTAKIMPVGQSNARLSVDGHVSTCISFSSLGTSYYLQVEFGSLGVITTLHFVFGDNTTADDGHAVYCSNTTDKWNDGILLYNGPRLDTDITIFAVCTYVTYVPPMLSGNSMVELCEIEIGGCQYGRYGENCEHVCPENCFGQGPCDLVSGNCSSGCLDGWVGAKCDQACTADTFGNECLLNCSKNCLSPPCNHVTGECDGGCTKGWERLNCTDKCSPGTFGWNCSEKCNGCTEDSCDHISGVCTNLSGCNPGYEYGRYCNKTCSPWYFGTNCTNYCNCLDSPCDTFSGQCATGGCKRGWDGVSCDKECTYGYFGFNCNGFCANCLNESCSVFDGNCTDGCFTGYSGDMCDIEECSKGKFGWNCTETCDGCIVNECNHINGVCKIDSVCKPGFVYGKYCNKMCDDWHFGTNCNKMCNCLEKPCNIFTGECSDDGCKKGWKGDSCDQECAYGYFGFNCAYRCETCFNQSCDIFEGNCRVGCNDGYRGRKCETQVSAVSLPLIKTSFFVGGFASMLGILLIILTVVIARRRIMKKQESRKGIDNSHSNSNEQHYDDIMKMESVSTYQDLAKQTINLSSDYDQINNAFTDQ